MGIGDETKSLLYVEADMGMGIVCMYDVSCLDGAKRRRQTFLMCLPSALFWAVRRAMYSDVTT